MKGNDTRDKLLRVAVDQTSVHGLAGVTLGQLASASGLSKSGLFAHFRSKEQLQIEILDASARTADEVIVAPAAAEAEGLPRLVATVSLWLGWSSRAGLSGGCPLAAALFELDDLAGEVRDHVARLEEHWRSHLRQLVRSAVDRAHLRADTDADQLVFDLCGIYLAHHVANRFLRQPDAADRARRSITALFARHRAEPQD